MRSSRLGSTLGYTRRSAAPSSAGSFAIAPSLSALAEEKRLEEQSKRAKEEEAGKKAEEHKRQQARIASILEQEKAERTAYEKKQEEIMAMAKAREDETRRNLIDAAKAIAAEETRIPETTEEHDSEAEEPTLVIDLTTSEPDEPVVITVSTHD